MDPVRDFVGVARLVVTRLDYVAACVQLGQHKNEPALFDTANLERHHWPLRRMWHDLSARMCDRGAAGAPISTAARTVVDELEQAAEGIRIAGDWRAWHQHRPRVVRLLDYLHPDDASVSPASTSSDESSTPASSTPSAHDIAASLTDNACSVLQTLLDSGATSRAAAVIRAGIEQASGVKGNSLRLALKSLRTTPEPCIHSAGSVSGGIWLTETGVSVANAIQRANA
jgi:hypothetical protein